MSRALVAIVLLAGCAEQMSTAEPEPTRCGEDAIEVTRDGVLACLFPRPKVVTETGFTCPEVAPFPHPWELVMVCADAEFVPDEVLGELAEEIPPLSGPAADGPTEIDLLFVVDDSNSMNQEQSALAEYAGQLFSTIVELGADFHVALVTTNEIAEDGAFRTSPGGYGGVTEPPGLDACAETTGPVLSASDYLDADNPSAGLDSERLYADFRCLCLAGTDGSGFEMGLEAARRALSPDRLSGTNAGFRRDGAWLVVVFLADENDCSHPHAYTLTTSWDCELERDELTPVSEYAAFFDSLGGARTIVTTIVAPDDGFRPTHPDEFRPVCSNLESGDAYNGYRYLELAEHYGVRGVVGNICTDPADAVDHLRALLIGLIDG